MNKHTPGPWSIRPIGGYPIIQSETGTLVAKTDCSLNSSNFVMDIDVSRANADLITSAPELLEALEALLESAKSSNASLNWATGLNDEPASFDQARTAIRKARGE